jgi:glycosyltransferase involved in cell wall biosynthesis
MPGVIAVSWQEHRRTREICGNLGIELHEVCTRARGLRRYAELGTRTLALLARNRGKTIIVQNPSLVLTLLAVLARPFFRLKVVRDAHNEAVEPYLNPSASIRRLTYWLLARADHVIVTNRQLAEVVTARRGRPVVLADRIPGAPKLAARGRDATFRVVFISTFARDEPLDEVLTAARTLGAGYEFLVTGNDKHLPAAVRATAPANVRFTGFLSEEDYWSELRDCDLVVDLSLIDNCLVCGAYEALAVGTPMVLSGSAASRELFGEAACYTDNSAASIVVAIGEARARIAALRANAAGVRDRMTRDWDRQADALRTLLAP